jgi:hypothetical protein
MRQILNKQEKLSRIKTAAILALVAGVTKQYH